MRFDFPTVCSPILFRHPCCAGLSIIIKDLVISPRSRFLAGAVWEFGVNKGWDSTKGVPRRGCMGWLRYDTQWLDSYNEFYQSSLYPQKMPW